MTSPPDPEAATLSTLALVTQAQAGDAAARERLFARYLPRLARWANGRLPARARGHLDTVDLVQDALVNTFRRLDRLNPERGGFFQAYTRQAVMNAIRDRVRLAREQVPPTAALAKEQAVDASPLEHAIGRDALARYEAAVARLSEIEREVVISRIEHHMSWREIADDLEIASADAARMMASRALARVARAMGHAG